MGVSGSGGLREWESDVSGSGGSSGMGVGSVACYIKCSLVQWSD